MRAAQLIGYDRIVARAEQIIAFARARQLGSDGIRLALLANLRAFELAGDQRGMVSTMAGLGGMLARSDPPAAARWIAEGIDAGISTGYWHGQAYCVVSAIVLAVSAGRPLDAARLDGALQPYLPTLRASLPPEQYAGYRAQADRARSALGDAAFDQAAGELAAGWPVLRDHAAAIAADLAGSPGPAGPAGLPGSAGLAGPRPRRCGPRSNPELTDREREVLAAIASGATNPQIAAALHLSPKTVMHHSTSVYRKLGVRGRAEAVAMAYRSGLLHHADPA